ncbi:MAG: DEAD/DEAH box helicase, partial [Deltaproteobacteria bacterium]|nr:DEAD/DEAH box helicase [Deltaproteobacteria bacterium]
RDKKHSREGAGRDFHRIEFHRHAIALIPEPGDKRPGVAFLAEGDKRGSNSRFCTCSTSRRKTCHHIIELSKIYRSLKKSLDGKSLDEDFKSSVWYRIARIMGEGNSITSRTTSFKYMTRRPIVIDHEQVQEDRERESGEGLVKVFDARGECLISYFSRAQDASRFAERLMEIEDKHNETVPNRAQVLGMLSRMTLNENERAMLHRGYKTRGLVLEESFWYRIAYHCYREFGTSEYAFRPGIEEASGAFTVTCERVSGETLFRMTVPRHLVKTLLGCLGEMLPNQHNLPIHPIPLKSIFKVTMDTEMDLDVRPVIQLIQENGEDRFFDREELEKFRYGDLVYIKEMGILAELERPDKQREFKAPVRMTLKKSQVPLFLEQFGDEIQRGHYLVDEEIRALKIFKEFDNVEFEPEAIERDWCWIDVKYGFGNTSISLREILSARKEDKRFIGTAGGWVDCQAPEIESIARAFPEAEVEYGPRGLKLTKMDIFRIRAANNKAFVIKGDSKRAELLRRIMDLKPSTAPPSLSGMRSTLRSYQRLGVQWLFFLFENGFGGLLCDDMGLGKTHQAMALMLGLKRMGKLNNPCLVVSPITVLSHWQNKIQEHVPELKAVNYHGGQRNLSEVMDNNDIILTSYGILRRDIEQLKVHMFSLVILDEIQHVKNPKTQGYTAARDLKAGMKLGLTGTPIENSLYDLKALMDMVIPGYLGSDHYFRERYLGHGENGLDNRRQSELSRLTSPFILRRLKKSVLRELPGKIEDIRTCRLSRDQVKLYRDAISLRGEDLIDTLRKSETPIPYIHIFALLNLLKQICDHPSLVDGKLDDYDRYRSGKWELFKEVFSEALGSNQKIVVYSQYLGMIRIIEKHLQGQGIGFVTLTGQSRNRGEIVARFNNDPDCRVYVGSLKAGGTGIDLVAASVVIHYDRWWNAAKEDQATDRVHRIGQKRGVHVLKLVTVGTLEEKISAMIQKKRNLVDSVIKEDDPDLLKSFSRDDLINLLGLPDRHEESELTDFANHV